MASNGKSPHPKEKQQHDDYNKMATLSIHESNLIMGTKSKEGNKKDNINYQVIKFHTKILMHNI